MIANPIFYFGCLGGVGHHLWIKRDGHICEVSSFKEFKSATPWGYDLDGCIFAESP